MAQGDPRTVLTGATLSRVYGWPIDVIEHAGADGQPGGPLVVPRLTPGGSGSVTRPTRLRCSAGFPVMRIRNVASAQHAPELRGRVLDAATSTPLQDAEVLSSDGARTVTGADGAFVLRALKPGPAQVTVRRVGYAPVVRDVELINGGASTLTVQLTRHRYSSRSSPPRRSRSPAAVSRPSIARRSSRVVPATWATSCSSRAAWW